MNLEGRRFVIITFFVVIGVIYTIKLFYMQVVDDSWKLRAQQLAEKRREITPPRAVVFDRNGNKIISNKTYYNLMMVENDIIETRVQGIVKNFRVVDTRYMSDGSVEVEVEVPISGVLTDALLPQWGAPRPVGQGYPVSEYPAQPANIVYTGLIIDARGAGVRPAMAPKIIDEAGNEVYGTGFVSREFAVQIGVVGYEKDINRAARNDRVTDNPLVVKAVGASGTNKNDIIISNRDTQNVIASAKNLNFMEQCKVMVILD